MGLASPRSKKPWAALRAMLEYKQQSSACMDAAAAVNADGTATAALLWCVEFLCGLWSAGQVVGDGVT